jgi:hypothetical protein
MSNIQDRLNEGVKQALEDLGTEILNIYKAQAPRRTGALANSIRFRVVVKGGEYSLSFYYLYYGVYVDLGTYSNADQTAYGLSAYDMPAWNINPGRGGKGIRPRYWTSLSQDANELQDYLSKRLEDLVGIALDDVIDNFTTRTQRNTA